MTRGLDDDTTVHTGGSTELIDSSDGAPAETNRQFLLVVDALGSRRIRLPRSGTFVIGRAADADVRLHDEKVSRRHATLELGSGAPVLVDQGSQNGTRVSGQRVAQPRPLRPGDVISIGRSTLVFQARQPTHVAQTALSLDELVRRGRQEIERALRFQRPFAVVAIRVSGGADQAAVIEAAIGRGIRAIDVFAWAADDELVVLMPELATDDAFDVTGRLIRDLSRVTTGVRGGFAVGPTDSDEFDALIEQARGATLTSTVSTGEVVSSAFRSFDLGGRTIIVADAAMLGIYKMAERLAASELPVLVQGETGTGKELVAHAVHTWSPRRDGPFIAVNCATFSETLAGSELFGHEKGAFTGAVASRPGVFERAHGGTVFLDEIGELSLPIQAALLRVLETRRVQRVGGDRELEVNFRLVSATHRDVAAAIAAGGFRQDLFYRLGAIALRLPPLRERHRELPVLAQALLEAACRAAGRPPKVLSRATTEMCARYAWPGNVRELKHAMDYLAATIDDSVIEPAHLEPVLAPDKLQATQSASAATDAAEPAEFRPLYDELAEIERERIIAALDATGGNQTRAAALLSIPLRTFQTKLKQHQIAAGPSRAERGPGKK